MMWCDIGPIEGAPYAHLWRSLNTHEQICLIDYWASTLLTCPPEKSCVLI